MPAVKVSLGGETQTGWLPPNAAEPRPTPVREVEFSIEIVDVGDGVLLQYEATDGSEVSDTWHATLEEAMQAAEEDFGVHRSDWETA
jgi:hypothetical protein